MTIQSWATVPFSLFGWVVCRRPPSMHKDPVKCSTTLLEEALENDRVANEQLAIEQWENNVARRRWHYTSFQPD